MEVGGSSGHPAMSKFKFAQGYAATDVSTEDMGKMAFVPLNTEKGKLSMGRMVELGW